MIVPWQLVAKKTGAVLRYISLTKDEVADMEQLKGLLSKRTKLVALHHVSNVLGLLLTFKTTGSNFFGLLKFTSCLIQVIISMITVYYYNSLYYAEFLCSPSVA